MTNLLLGTVLLAAGILALVFLRPRGTQERLIVRFPAAWIIVGLLVTLCIAGGAALLADAVFAR